MEINTKFDVVVDEPSFANNLPISFQKNRFASSDFDISKTNSYLQIGKTNVIFPHESAGFVRGHTRNISHDFFQTKLNHHTQFFEMNNLDTTSLPSFMGNYFPTLADQIVHDDSISLSTNEDSEDIDGSGVPLRLPMLDGNLNKWTNLFQGWQERYFILINRTLSYFKNKEEVVNGCRGYLRLRNVLVKPHESDDCRFELRVGENIWFLRASSCEERNAWIQSIEFHRISDSAEVSSLSNQSQVRSLTSFFPGTTCSSLMTNHFSNSGASTASFHRGQCLKAKLSEMETFRETLCKQVDSLQAFFDNCDRIIQQQTLYDPDIHPAADSNGFDDDVDSEISTFTCSGLDNKMAYINDSDLSAGEFEKSNSADWSNDDSVPNDATIANASPVTPKSESPIINSSSSTTSQPTGLLSRLFWRNNTITTNSTASPAKKNGEEDQHKIYYSDLEMLMRRHEVGVPDFKGEASTFKATTAGIIATMKICIEEMVQSEDQWRLKLKNERKERIRAEQFLKAKISNLTEQLRRETDLVEHFRRSDYSSGVPSSVETNVSLSRSINPKMIIPNPNYEEGPHCTINEEQFFDALDTQLDIIEHNDEIKQAIQAASKINSNSNSNEKMTPSHKLYDRIESEVRDHLILCDPTARVLRVEDGWQEIARDGEMRMYKREMESPDGKVLDPLQAMHIIDGITARELCHYFWSVKYRLEWEFTIDQMPTVLEECDKNTVVLHQIYRRVWPASQRDAVFWSHIRPIDPKELKQYCSTIDDIPNNNDNTAQLPNNKMDYWMVLNCSTDYKAPSLLSNNELVRLKLDVVMIGQTLRRKSDLPLSRSNVCCRMLYSAKIDPGGWAPASVLRKLAEREYPRFVKQFSAYVVEKTRNTNLMF